MPYRFCNRPKELMTQLADTAWWQTGLFDRIPKPGESILSLPAHQRDLLKNLKSDDIKDVIWERTSWGDFVHKQRAGRPGYWASK